MINRLTLAFWRYRLNIERSRWQRPQQFQFELRKVYPILPIRRLQNHNLAIVAGRDIRTGLRRQHGEVRRFARGSVPSDAGDTEEGLVLQREAMSCFRRFGHREFEECAGGS